MLGIEYRKLLPILLLIIMTAYAVIKWIFTFALPAATVARGPSLDVAGVRHDGQ